jgi:hypothetical protein
MADFKIVRIGSQPPRTWSFKDKKTGVDVQMETYKVMLEGEEESVDVNRKPGNAPEVGNILSGTLETTDFGKKFKPAPKAGFANFTPKDQEAIRAQWAIGQAVSLEKKADGTYELKTIELTAGNLFAMVERVKNGGITAEKPRTEDTVSKTGYDKAKEARDNLSQTFNNGEPLPDDEPINLNDIDF